MCSTTLSIKGLFNNIKKCITSDELFAIDHTLMHKFGFWSSNKICNRKVYLISLFILIFDWFPKCNFLRKTILNKEYHLITLSIPEILITSSTLFIIQNFLLCEMKIKDLIQMLEVQWKKSLLMKNSEWMIAQSKTVIATNKMSFIFKLMIYSATLFYCYLPICIFFFKYHLLGMKDEKFKIIMAEYNIIIISVNYFHSIIFQRLFQLWFQLGTNNFHKYLSNHCIND